MQKGFSELFSESWREYKGNFKLFLKIFWWFAILPGLIIFLPFNIFFTLNFVGKFLQTSSGNIFSNFTILAPHSFLALTGNTINSSSSLISFSNPWIFGLILIFLVAIFLKYMIYLSIFFSSIYNQKLNMTFKQAVKGGLNYFWSFIGLTLLVIILLIPLFFLLIVPGIIFSVYWGFSPYVLMRENTGIWESIKRSKLIVKGRWWRVFGYSLLLGIIIGLISAIIQLPSTIIDFWFKVISLGSSNISFLIIPIIFKFIFSLIASIVTIPLFILFFKNFYVELRKNLAQKER